MSHRPLARRLGLGRAVSRTLALEPLAGRSIDAIVIGIVTLLVLLLSSTGGP
ncbi:MAG TPA: hypothetical protein VNB06_04410 [Thermoanaerobaculia bacterium]|nr:hypothetical protein [Thermoanaerobaculia bacterium]